MHSMTAREWSMNFNGDFSGNVEFIAPTGEHYGIPFNVLMEVVAECIRRERINALDSSTAESILGIEPRY